MSTKISALTTDTAPDRTADYVPTYNASDASKSYKVLLSNLGGYLIPFYGVSTAAADATTYYYTGFSGLWQTTYNRIYIPRAGIVKKIRLYFAGTAGSNENSTISFRLNDTTDTTISSVIALNSLPFTVVNSALSIAVAEDDHFAIKWVTPTWVTNPTVAIAGWVWVT